MFFINDVFYVDGRCPGNLDYSIEVKEWAKSKKLPFELTEFMESVRFNSIKFRLGYPYLFMHQGGCEHLIIFTDARYVIPLDFLKMRYYMLATAY